MLESRQVLAPAHQHTERPGDRQYNLQEVFSQQRVSAFVERSYLVLSEAGYTKGMGQARKARDPAIATATVLSAQGQQEKVYLFRADSHPHRRLVVMSGLEETKDVLHVACDGHDHEMQGKRVWESMIQDDWKESQLKSVLGQGGHFLCSVDEFKAKLKKRQAPADENAPGTDGKAKQKLQRGVPVEIDDDEEPSEDDDDGDDDASVHFGENEAATTEPQAAGSSGDGKAGITSKFWEGAKRARSKEFDKAAPSVAPRPSFSSSASMAPSRLLKKEWDLPDSASTADSMALVKKPDRQLTVGEWPTKHVQKTPIMAALRGEKAMGVQLQFAKEDGSNHGCAVEVAFEVVHSCHLSWAKGVAFLATCRHAGGSDLLLPIVDVWPTLIIETVFFRRNRDRVEKLMTELHESSLKICCLM